MPAANRLGPRVATFRRRRVQGCGGQLYLMMLPGLTALLLFRYLPIFGIVLAFKDYNYIDGIWGSAWNGLENFRFFFSSDSGIRAIRNTIYLNVLFIIFQTVVQVGLALVFSQITARRFRKLTQTIILLPHFISWMLVSAIAYNIMNFEFGVLSSAMRRIGLQPSNVYAHAEYWPAILFVTNTWKVAGYGSIIYLATLSSINEEYYEAAKIDGVGRLQCTWYISIPHLMPTMIVLTLISLGKILNTDFGMFYGMVHNNGLIYETADVIDMYVYRTLRVVGDVGMSSAASFFQSIAGFLLVLGTNLLARRFKD